eukprot:Gb_17385 [translate_table: standard]
MPLELGTDMYQRSRFVPNQGMQNALSCFQDACAGMSHCQTWDISFIICWVIPCDCRNCMASAISLIFELLPFLYWLVADGLKGDAWLTPNVAISCAPSSFSCASSPFLTYSKHLSAKLHKAPTLYPYNNILDFCQRSYQLEVLYLDKPSTCFCVEKFELHYKRCWLPSTCQILVEAHMMKMNSIDSTYFSRKEGCGIMRICAVVYCLITISLPELQWFLKITSSLVLLASFFQTPLKASWKDAKKNLQENLKVQTIVTIPKCLIVQTVTLRSPFSRVVEVALQDILILLLIDYPQLHMGQMPVDLGILDMKGVCCERANSHALQIVSEIRCIGRYGYPYLALQLCSSFRVTSLLLALVILKQIKRLSGKA